MLWYCDTIGQLLHVLASGPGLIMAPLFSLCALLVAVSTQIRVAGAMPGLHEELQAEGHDGASRVAAGGTTRPEPNRANLCQSEEGQRRSGWDGAYPP